MRTSTERPVRKPASPRGKAVQNAKRYNKQTAHVEARRDGKPLIFGWGTHLSHTAKVRIQRRATWGAAALVFLLLAAVFVGSWININIVIPGLPITSVNGHAIPQSQYRTMVAVKTQLELNKLYGPNGLTAQSTNLEKQDALQNQTITQTQTQITNLNAQIKKLPDGPSAQRTDLTTQLTAANKKLADAQTQDQKLQSQLSALNTTSIANAKQTFTQQQIGNDSAAWLQDDELIREWLQNQPAAIQAKINPSASQVNRAFTSLKTSMPQNNGYNTFLNQMGIGDSDIRSMLTIIGRRDNLQNYLAPMITSPSYQVLARQIVVPTKDGANKILSELQKGQDFAKLAASDSKDSTTNTKGGALVWLTRYQYLSSESGPGGPATVENWLFDSARKVNQISPVLFGNGSYYIVQITGLSGARPVTPAIVTELKGNALINWLQERGGNSLPLPDQKITTPDQNKMFNDPNNLPPNNILPAAAPAPPSQQPAGGGPPPA
ncbi:MAG: peptidylprolyl isomerase [Ktedonobacteraceae bacterium]